MGSRLSAWLGPLPQESSRCSPWTLAIHLRILLLVCALGIDYTLVPALYNGRTLLAAAVFALLLFPSQRSAPEQGLAAPAALALGRLSLFAGGHAALILLARAATASLAAAAQTDSLAASALAAAKLLVLLPTLLLFPRHTWAALTRRFRPELLASLIVLLSFFPVRLFHLAWPHYSPLLGTTVYHCARPFVAGLHYLPGADPILSGPRIDMRIIVDCSGIEGLYLFDLVFGAVVLLEWRRLHKRRVLLAYLLGLAATLLANLLRLILLVLVANLISPEIGRGDFHRHVGWVLFATVFTVFLFFTYGWMKGQPAGKQALVESESNAT